MSADLRGIDRRIQHALRGRETTRGVVVGSPEGRIVPVRIAGAVLPAIVPVLPFDLVAGMVVELERPRGITGQLYVVRVLGG